MIQAIKKTAAVRHCEPLFGNMLDILNFNRIQLFRFTNKQIWIYDDLHPTPVIRIIIGSVS